MQVVTVEPGGHTRDHSRKTRLLLVTLQALFQEVLGQATGSLAHACIPIMLLLGPVRCSRAASHIAELWGAWEGADHCGGGAAAAADAGGPLSGAAAGWAVAQHWQGEPPGNAAQHCLQGTAATLRSHPARPVLSSYRRGTLSMVHFQGFPLAKACQRRRAASPSPVCQQRQGTGSVVQAKDKRACCIACAVISTRPHPPNAAAHHSSARASLLRLSENQRKQRINY